MISMFVNLPWNKSKAQRLRIKIVDKYMEKKVFLNFFDKKKRVWKEWNICFPFFLN